MDLGLAGRVALVGGGSSGLGRACASRLAAEGCRVILWSRHEDRLRSTAESLRRQHGVQVDYVTADAGDPAAAGIVATRAHELAGNVDIAVLNSGGPPTVDPTGTDPDGWRAAFQLLAITPIELATRLLPAMREQHWGRIVSILTSGVRQPITELPYSNACRSAIMAWLKTTAPVVIADGVTMNGVIPGRFDTPRVESLDHGRAQRTGRPIDEVVAEQLRTIPARRYGDPDELAGLVAFLCSDVARYQTGTFIPVDGGMINSLP